MKKPFRLIIMTICCMLALTACKASDTNSGGSVQNEIQQQSESNAELTEPFNILTAYNNKKHSAMSKLIEHIEQSYSSAEDGDLSEVQLLTTQPVYTADTDLSTALYCLSKLEVKAENDWSLQYERYSGYMDYVDEEYRFEFYTDAAYEQSTMGTPRPNEASEIEIDPLETAEEITEQQPMIPNELAGYIEGRVVDGGNRIVINTYTGREEQGTRAQTLWFEFIRDTEGGYWVQYYYAWDNVGYSFNTLRVHVNGDAISYAVLKTTDRPGSILSLQRDEEVFYMDAETLMRFDGSKATYYEDGQVALEF